MQNFKFLTKLSTFVVQHARRQPGALSYWHLQSSKKVPPPAQRSLLDAACASETTLERLVTRSSEPAALFHASIIIGLECLTFCKGVRLQPVDGRWQPPSAPSDPAQRAGQSLRSCPRGLERPGRWACAPSRASSKLTRLPNSKAFKG